MMVRPVVRNTFEVLQGAVHGTLEAAASLPYVTLNPLRASLYRVSFLFYFFLLLNVYHHSHHGCHSFDRRLDQRISQNTRQR